MLERSAAGIESCGIQRVLPRTRKPLRSSRRLHTSFWKHGAADIELSSTWHELARGPLKPLDLLGSGTGPVKLDLVNASVVMLDFLYPKGALAYLRGLSPAYPDRKERNRSLVGIPSRSFTSSSSVRSPPPDESSEPNDETTNEDHPLTDQHEQPDTNIAGAVDAQTELGKSVEPATAVDFSWPRSILPKSWPKGWPSEVPSEAESDLPLPSEESQPATNERESQDIATFRKMLDSGDQATTRSVDEIWEHYISQGPNFRKRFGRKMTHFLHVNGRLHEEPLRVSLLYSNREVHEWNIGITRLAVKAELALDNYPRAFSIFEECLTYHKQPAGLGYLLAHALESSDWAQLEEIWNHYIGFIAQRSAAGAQILTDLKGGTLNSLETKLRRGQLHPFYEYEIKAVTRLSDKISALAQHIDTEAPQEEMRSNVPEAGGELLPASLKGAFVSIATAVLGELDPAFARELVHWTMHPFAFEELIKHCALTWNKPHVAIEAFRIYQTLPNVEIRGHTLKAMLLGVYLPLGDTAGVEQMLRYMYRRYGQLNLETYRATVNYYARRGHSTDVYRLWNEYTGHFPGDVTNGSAFIPLMIHHVARREISQVERIFEELKTVHHAPQLSVHYNILLRGRLRNNMYSAGNRLFRQMWKDDIANQISFGTVMYGAGIRGDLEWCLELYRWSKQRDIPQTTYMANGIVEAFCQNGRYAEAESLCHGIHRQKGIEGDQVELWNTLLKHHAERRDLTNVHRIMQSMTKLGLAYNNRTYDCLLRGLLLCRQSHHALLFLEEARKDEENPFQPTQDHYTILMASFLRTGDNAKVLRLNEMMRDMGLKRATDDHLTIVSSALSKWNLFPHEEQVDRMGRILRMFLRQVGLRRSDPDWTPAMSNRLFGGVVLLFAQFRDFVTVRELVELFLNLVEEMDRELGLEGRQPASRLTRPLLRQILAAQVHDGEHDRAKETWEYLFRTAVEAGQGVAVEDFRLQPPSSPAHESDATSEQEQGSDTESQLSSDPENSQQPTPDPGDFTPSAISSTGQSFDRKLYVTAGLRHSLCDAFLTMQTLYESTADAPGLIAEAERLTAAGFRLDSRNLNAQVQALARLKRWKEAFSICEERLMPQWTGWARVRKRLPVTNLIPLERRRLGTHRSFNRPTHVTLATLAKEYYDLQQMAPWSRDAARLLREVDEKFPRCVNAATTMVRTRGDPTEEDIFGDWAAS